MVSFQSKLRYDLQTIYNRKIVNVQNSINIIDLKKIGAANDADIVLTKALIDYFVLRKYFAFESLVACKKRIMYVKWRRDIFF